MSDEPQYIAWDRLTEIGRYIQRLVGTVADLDHRPVVDKPKPDPDSTCPAMTDGRSLESGVG